MSTARNFEIVPHNCETYRIWGFRDSWMWCFKSQAVQYCLILKDEGITFFEVLGVTKLAKKTRTAVRTSSLVLC